MVDAYHTSFRARLRDKIKWKGGTGGPCREGKDGLARKPLPLGDLALRVPSLSMPVTDVNMEGTYVYHSSSGVVRSREIAIPSNSRHALGNERTHSCGDSMIPEGASCLKHVQSDNINRQSETPGCVYLLCFSAHPIEVCAPGAGGVRGNRSPCTCK